MEKMIKIDKNIPMRVIKKTESTRKFPIIYPFAEMEIGDSFFISQDTYASDNSIQTNLYNYVRKMKQDYKIAIRQADGGMRCWRIE